MNEEELIRKLISKDQSVFREFIDCNKSKVVRICYGFVNNTQDAEDIAQEVFIEIFLSIKNFRRGSSLNTWVYRIAVNKSLDFIKKSKRLKRAGKFLSILGLSPKDEIFLKDNDTPFSLIEKNEKNKMIISALNKLPVNQRTALTLNKYECMSYKEIADILNTSDSAVDSLIQRAKKNLKKYLQSEGF